MLEERKAPDWLATDGLLAQFSTEREEAIRRYVQFVAEGRGLASICDDLKCPIYLGDAGFVDRMQGKKGRALEDHRRADGTKAPTRAVD